MKIIKSIKALLKEVFQTVPVKANLVCPYCGSNDFDVRTRGVNLASSTIELTLIHTCNNCKKIW